MIRERKYIAFIMICVLLVIQAFPVLAEENSTTEWYEMVEEEFDDGGNDLDDIVMPYTQYIMNVQTTIAKLSSSKVGLRADVYCSSTVQTVTVTFYLQKKSGSTWVNVSSGTPASVANVNRTNRQATVSGLSSGTYRAKSVTRVTDYNGYSEAITGYSGTISL